jgi:hypothetical protein
MAIVKYEDSLEYKKLQDFPLLSKLFNSFLSQFDRAEGSEYKIGEKVKSEICFIEEIKVNPKLNEDNFNIFVNKNSLYRTILELQLNNKEEVGLSDLQKVIDNHLTDVMLDYKIKGYNLKDESYIYEDFLNGLNEDELKQLSVELKQYNPTLYKDITEDKDDIFDNLISTEFFAVSYSVQEAVKTLKNEKFNATIYFSPAELVKEELFKDSKKEEVVDLKEKIKHWGNKKETDVKYALIASLSLNDILLQKTLEVVNEMKEGINFDPEDIRFNFKNVLTGFANPTNKTLGKFDFNLEEISLPVLSANIVLKEDKGNQLVAVEDMKYFSDEIYQKANLSFSEDNKIVKKQNNKNSFKI